MFVALSVVLAAFFLIPFPAALTSVQPTFQLQGYVSETDHTLNEVPVYGAETDTFRPIVNVSFVAPVTGTCMVLQIESPTADRPEFRPIGSVDVVKGQRAFKQAVFPTTDDLGPDDDWTPLISQRRKVFVVCSDASADADVFASQIYQVNVAQNS